MDKLAQYQSLIRKLLTGYYELGQTNSEDRTDPLRPGAIAPGIANEEVFGY